MRETSPKDKEAETVWEVATKEAIQGAPRESGTGRDSQPVKDAGHGGSGALGSSGKSKNKYFTNTAAHYQIVRSRSSSSVPWRQRSGHFSRIATFRFGIGSMRFIFSAPRKGA